jgi:hypothetical protein
MKRKELTKKLLKGSPCETCTHKWMMLQQIQQLPYTVKGPRLANIARPSNKEEGWCSIYPEPNITPGYRTQCTCKHYSKKQENTSGIQTCALCSF